MSETASALTGRQVGRPIDPAQLQQSPFGIALCPRATATLCKSLARRS